MSRESRLRNGSYEYAQINVNSAGVDDLLTRGNGVRRTCRRTSTRTSSTSGRARATGRTRSEAELFSGGLAGNRQGRLQHRGRAHLLHQRRVQRVRRCVREPHAGLAGVAAGQSHRQFRRPRSAVSTPASTGPSSNRQELRLRLQAIGLDAGVRQAYRVDAGRQRDRERRAGRRLQRAQPGLPDPLSVRARAAVVSVRRVRPRRLRPGADTPTARAGCCATASRCATTNSCWSSSAIGSTTRTVPTPAAEFSHLPTAAVSVVSDCA